ncbi:septal ring lytic transglycosylase RlpA family protein [Candidatus Sumerlaeota bacterium]|nr:septal ring lytic transglycosylase RlpA family protein [Candidatus Sumerlaeota bacterium]
MVGRFRLLGLSVLPLALALLGGCTIALDPSTVGTEIPDYENPGIEVPKPYFKMRRRSFPNAERWPMIVNEWVGCSYLPEDGFVSLYDYEADEQNPLPQTASGEPYDPNGLTAAHPSLPFNTLVRVSRVDTQKSVVVRINDRGPDASGRVMNLTPRAAHKLNLDKDGVAPCRLEVLEYPAVEVAGPGGKG